MKFLIIIFFYLIIIVPSSASSQEKVVFLDINLVLSKSNKGKLILKKLEEKNKANLSQLKLKEDILKNLEIDLEKKKNILSENELEDQINDLKNKIINFRKEKKILTDEFNKFKNKEIAALMQLINPIISDYVEKNSINLVIDKNNILIGKKSYDITQDILELVNKKLNND